MSQFITLEDYDASIHREILDALVRQDETVIEICEDRARCTNEKLPFPPL